MATAQDKAAVGGASWIQAEREQTGVFVRQDVEEFTFSVRNEMEWLNEHMADIFSNGNLNLADIFKTPGKLRGKTPRTARKVHAAGTPRQPLTDIFAPNAQFMPPPAQKGAFHDDVAQFQIAEDDKENGPQRRPISRSKSPQRIGKPGYTDSGYHGMTEDEMDVDTRTETATVSSQQSEVHKLPLRDDEARPQPVRQYTGTGEGEGISDDSFQSAKEDLTSRNASKDPLRDEAQMDENAGATHDDDVAMEENEMETQDEDVEPESVEEDADVDAEAPGTPSDASSPEKPLQRKSSFTFSSLPAREPLTGKRSMGADAARNSVLARSFGAKSIGHAKDDEEEHRSEEAKVHTKTSTQSLHERIMMLGKTKEPRPSKSIPAAVLYPQLPSTGDDGTTVPANAAPELPAKEEDASVENEDDDDWIAPSKTAHVHPQQVLERPTTPSASPARPTMHQKSISTTYIPSPSRPTVFSHKKSQSVYSVAGAPDSTTPAGSPMVKRQEGPLSASKSKLWSAIKSAKSIFASSASASAAAKLEAHNNPAPQRPATRDEADDLRSTAVFNMPGALYSQPQVPAQSVVSLVSASPLRKTRSSNESDKKRDKESKAQAKAADALEKVREKERQKVAKEQQERRKAEEAEAMAKAEQEAREAAEAAQRPATSGHDGAAETERAPPSGAKSLHPPGKLRAPGRLVRPTRTEPAARPAPVSIRVASQSQRMGQPAQSFSKSQHESTAPPPPPPKTGLRTTSAMGNARTSAAPNNARVKALEAAARKKEADERAAQRKLEQKRELERKRAAKAEEERRAEEERKAAEQARVQEARLAAQRKADQQAAEARKREMQRLDQQRQQEEAQKAKAAYELAEAIKRERAAQAPPAPRGDVGGTLRQLAKNTVSEQTGRPPLQPNPAKPAKRLFQTEDDEPVFQQQPQRPGMPRAPPSFQQNDAKRRKTNEDQDEPPRHSVMAPPRRPSNMRKESTLRQFPHGYTHAPPPAAHHAPSMFKSTVTAQHQLQHGGKPNHPSQTVQVSNARIPFAETNNPPGPAHQQYKTPARPAQAPKSAKSSPAYPKGDNIELPEIATDSEDEEDSDEETGGFRAPSWAASPALRDLLTQQQLVDPESVFGPIGELKMDEVFKNGKNQERLKRFRDRGSSAMWVETGDAVTSAEKRRDMEVRERVAKEGGWRYEPGK
ncbi:C-type lectin [Teratosphaeria destructans]|uniref:C-type lectin n=1 Tax=Teratosphaeria destructans TaxID=418781 RepID=A0A9W7W1U8_9PEZI|nr:C-type lectin [Teratosphaeria destructans]